MTMAEFITHAVDDELHPKFNAQEENKVEKMRTLAFQVPEDRKLSMRLPHDLIPTDPKTGRVAAMNLRADDTFVEDAGWHAASANYAAFLKAHEGQHVLFLELGVGGNTPVIIKYPFWAMTAENPKAVYACLNRSAAVCPKVFEDRSICIDGDTGEVLKRLL